MFFQTLLTCPVAGCPGRTSNILYRNIQADFWMQFDLSKSISVSLSESSTFCHGKTSILAFWRLRLSHLRSPYLEDPSILSKQMSLDCVDCRSHIEAVWRVMKKKNNKQSFFCDALHVGPVILFCTGYCQAMLQKDSLHFSEDSTSCTVPRRETEGWGHETGRFLN